MDINIPKELRRRATFLPLEGTRERPNIIIPYHQGMERQELQFLCEGVLHGKKLSEAEIVATMEEAERQYEARLKVAQVRREIRRRLEGQVPILKRRKHRWEDL